VLVDVAYRGQKLGLAAIYRAIQKFARDCRFVSLEAVPLQLITKEPHVREKMGLNRLEKNEKIATNHLKAYYTQLGFEIIPRSNHMVLDLELKKPSLEDINFANLYEEGSYDYFEVSSAVLSDELENFVMDISGKVVEEDDNGAERCIGEIEATYVDIENVFNEDCLLEHVFDAHSDKLEHYYDLLFSPQSPVYKYIMQNHQIETNWPECSDSILFVLVPI
jgi:hypothetical protein